jgi:cAMP phosphodiesterase
MLSIVPLGCYGSDLENKKSISMLVSPSIVIDTGSIMSSLDTDQLLAIKHVIITHCHFDHVKNLPIFADFMLSLGNHSFTVYTTENIMTQIMDHIFNDLVWPDFTRLPSRKSPTIKFQPIRFDEPFSIEGTEFLPIEVDHVVESLGFIIRHGGDTIAYSGDTGICSNFVDHINSDPSIKTICWETSFPNRLEKLATASKHLTPAMLAGELEKINRHCEIHTFHLKPNLEDEIIADTKSIKSPMKIIPMKQKRPITVS